MAKQGNTQKSIQIREKSSAPLFQNAERWYPLLIFVFSLVIYFNTVNNDYNLDDELVTQNHRLTSQGVSAIPEIFRSPYYQDRGGYKYEYRPMVLVSFAIEHSFFGDDPKVSHLFNIILYALLCVLLFKVLQSLLYTYSPLFALCVTLLFVVHPVHTEVVASIKNRDEILALTFAMLSLNSATRFARSKGIIHLALIPAFFFLGILSKSTTITFALLIPLCLVMLTGISFKSLLLVTATLAIPTIFFARLYSVSQQVMLTLTLFLSVALLYYLCHFRLLTDRAGKYFIEKYNSLISRGGIEILPNSSLDFSFLKNGLAISAAVVFMLAITGTSLFGIFTGAIWFSVIPLMILALLFLFVRKELQLILLTPISLISLFALVKLHRPDGLAEAGLIIFLIGQILSDNKWFRIIGALNYLIYALVCIFIFQSYYFAVIFFFAGFIDRRLLPVTMVLALATSAFIFKHIFHLFKGVKDFRLAFLSLPFIYMGFLLLWRNRLLFLQRLSVIALPGFILLYFIVAPPLRNDEISMGVRQNYNRIGNLKAIDATPVQAVRPLQFIEYPIDSATPLSVKAGTAMIILGHYLKLIFIPYPLSFYYGYAYIVPTPLLHTGPLILFFIHFSLLAVALFYIGKDRMLSFPILFYLIAVSVFSNLAIPIPGLMGDRFLFIPSIAFCFFGVVILAKIFRQSFTDKNAGFNSMQKYLKITLCVILVSYSLLTVARNRDWKNRITLFSNDINTVENSAQAQNLLGLHLFVESTKETDAAIKKRMREEAIPHFKRAMEIYPQFLNAAFDMGRTYESMQRYDEAFAAYELAMKIDTTFVAPCYSMAVIEQNRGNWKGAIPLYEKFLKKDPRRLEVYSNLSYAYFNLGEYDKSLAVNRKALTNLPNAFEPRINMAKTFLQINQKDSAIAYFEQAGRVNPGDPNVPKILNDLRGQ